MDRATELTARVMLSFLADHFRRDPGSYDLPRMSPEEFWETCDELRSLMDDSEALNELMSPTKSNG